MSLNPSQFDSLFANSKEPPSESGTRFANMADIGIPHARPSAPFDTAAGYTDTSIPLGELTASQAIVSEPGVRLYSDKLAEEDRTGESSWSGESLAGDLIDESYRTLPTVEYDGENHFISDGHHRMAAFKLAGMSSVPARVNRNSPWA